MNNKKYVLAIDQGTTSSRAIIFDTTGKILGIGRKEFRQYYPGDGYVEHDPLEILHTVCYSMDEAVKNAGINASEIASVGITNQRETTVVWNKHTGKPVYNAIVWQCRRTAPQCEALITGGYEAFIKGKTGLVIDAYFSGSKIAWILDNVPGAREEAENGELLFGTIDTWLIWNLTCGNHYTDYSNASRTMLFNIHTLKWDEEICKLLNIPTEMLPEPVPNVYTFGAIKGSNPYIAAFDGIKIKASIGDQQAALLGQGCLTPGEAKNTYGTGCFMLMNAGTVPGSNTGGILTTVAWSVNGQTVYANEGSVFNAGSTIQWLRDELGIISSGRECDVLAESVPDNGGVYMIPAFTGLGAPHWNMNARGALFGLTRGASRAHIARAVLEGIAYRVKELADAMADAAGLSISILYVDGGASCSDILMQYQADLLNASVARPENTEATALGAAFLAGLSEGLWSDISDILKMKVINRNFAPVNTEKAKENFKIWQNYLKKL